MNNKPHIVFIGAGNMASSIIGGLVANDYPAGMITASAPSQENLSALTSQFKVNTTSDNHQATAEADILVLAVKPQILQAVCEDLAATLADKTPLIISIAAGVEIPYLEAWLDKAVYGLAEWNAEAITQAQLVAVPGCYPTASQLALKPLVEFDLLDKNQWPVINATSGVTGAGRKANLASSFCEVSLQPYGVFTHRHQPEIAAHLGCDVIFTPHLGNFKRGILATITTKLTKGVTEKEIQHAFDKSYGQAAAVRLLGNEMPKIQSVEKTPFCDIGWKVQGEHLIVVSAIDNLLKGASSQAIQCINIRFGFPMLTSLI